MEAKLSTDVNGYNLSIKLLYRGKEEIHSEIKSQLFINWSGTVQQIL